MTHEIFGQVPGSRVSWASEIMFFSGQHGAPTIDAIGHIGRDLKLHGGVDAVAATSTPGGIGNNLGIDIFPADLMINRCVFLDVARQVNGGRPDPLAPDVEITGAHLEQTMKAQGVEVRDGRVTRRTIQRKPHLERARSNVVDLAARRRTTTRALPDGAC